MTKVLACGKGGCLVSVVTSLLESGAARVEVLLRGEDGPTLDRIREIASEARRKDPDIRIETVTLQVPDEKGLRQAVSTADMVLYLAEAEDREELHRVNRLCREENKVFLPGLCTPEAGIAGPVVRKGSADWESVWRRLRPPHPVEKQKPSAAAAAMLANLIVFEGLKTAAGILEEERKNTLYLLDPFTLEGGWHVILPHPLADQLGDIQQESVEHVLAKEPAEADRGRTLGFLGSLASPHTGILHMWDERDARQLPLAQCFVQAADPLEAGAEALLPLRLCCAFTHEEARMEAGLTGVEDYAARLAGKLGADRTGPGFLGVGAGETAAEAVLRALRKCLEKEWLARREKMRQDVHLLEEDDVRDEECLYAFKALSAYERGPVMAIGQPLWGFPVAWVEAKGVWYGALDYEPVSALRRALRRALQNSGTREEAEAVRERGLTPAAVRRADRPPQHRGVLPGPGRLPAPDILREALQKLQNNGIQAVLWDLAVEPFWRDALAGLYGVQLKEVKAR
ncbi:hypothetical protein N6H14_22165 [Paenibacillus sp. CC-CFT747]|nr:hypothetical protein N6H14_22165 [Paenibacillus sp. CC-CFT747]